MLITTGIITTIIYCNHKQQHEDDQTSGMARVTVVNKSNTNMLYNRGVNGVGHGVIVRDPRTHTSESFCFSKYHGFNNGGPSPVPHLVTSQSNNNLDAVQGTFN